MEHWNQSFMTRKILEKSAEECKKDGGIVVIVARTAQWEGSLNKPLPYEAKTFCVKDLEIEVVEMWHGGETKPEIMDEKRFVDLYERDSPSHPYLSDVINRGQTGDAIAQGRWFRAKLKNKDPIEY